MDADTFKLAAAEFYNEPEFQAATRAVIERLRLCSTTMEYKEDCTCEDCATERDAVCGDYLFDSARDAKLEGR